MLQICKSRLFPVWERSCVWRWRLSFLVNLIWIIFFGLEMAIGYCILGCLWCITILGIPIGKQCFKMAKLSLMPFGASVV